MGTRSRIAIKNPDNTYTSVYCHWDGYPEGVGSTLVKHYNTEVKVKELLALGDLSCLEKNLNPTEPHSFDCPQDDVTVAYGRDRGESDQDATTDTTLSAVQCEEYTYVFTDNTWTAYKGKRNVKIPA
jgi:hypothetical protein